MIKKLNIFIAAILLISFGISQCIDGNCKNGQGTFKWEGNDSSTGDTYVGEWKNSKRHGKGTIIFDLDKTLVHLS